LKKGKDVGINQGQLIDTYVEGAALINISSQIKRPKSMPKRLTQSSRPVRRNR